MAAAASTATIPSPDHDGSSSQEPEPGNSSSQSASRMVAGDQLFGKFVIPSASIFYRTSRSFAFVNLRPIVPGHVLVVPVTPTQQYMKDLSEEDYVDLWKTVRVVQEILQQAYPNTSAFNVAVQDGRAAGQSVPHVHVHILPRANGDLEQNDDVYNELEQWAPRQELARSQAKLEVAPDEDRKDRTRQQMADEAAIYRDIVNKTM